MHTLIVGMTESGKSTLAKIMVRDLIRAGQNVIILDPIGDPGWIPEPPTDPSQVAMVYDDPAVFDKVLRNGRSYFVFIDEGGDIFDEGRNRDYDWWATRSRHYGHSVTFISQRAIQIPRTMRDQCSRLYLFTSSVADGKLLAEEWNKPQLAECNTLPQFTFWKVDRYRTEERLRIVNYSKIEPATVPTPTTHKRKHKSGTTP